MAPIYFLICKMGVAPTVLLLERDTPGDLTRLGFGVGKSPNHTGHSTTWVPTPTLH